MKQQGVAYPKLGKLLLPVLCDHQPNPYDPISCQATTSPQIIVTRHCGWDPSLSAPLNYCTRQTGRFSSTQHQPTVQHHLSATIFLFFFFFPFSFSISSIIKIPPAFLKLHQEVTTSSVGPYSLTHSWPGGAPLQRRCLNTGSNLPSEVCKRRGMRAYTRQYSPSWTPLCSYRCNGTTACLVSLQQHNGQNYGYQSAWQLQPDCISYLQPWPLMESQLPALISQHAHLWNWII